MEQANSNAEYFARRANEEAEAAERAEDDRARQLHLELAQRYAAAARSGGAAPVADPSVAPPGAPAALLQPEFRILP